MVAVEDVTLAAFVQVENIRLGYKGVSAGGS